MKQTPTQLSNPPKTNLLQPAQRGVACAQGRQLHQTIATKVMVWLALVLVYGHVRFKRVVALSSKWSSQSVYMAKMYKPESPGILFPNQLPALAPGTFSSQ